MKSANIFEDLKKDLLKIDPVHFAKHYLSIDGKPLDLTENGWKFWSDIYRMTAISAFKKDSKPIVILKGRQVAATTFASAIEMYFTTSGICGNNKYPPIQILHCFPALAQVQKYGKDKLGSIMRTSKDNYVLKQLIGYDAESGRKTQDDTSTLTYKQFKNQCSLWIDSNANDASRLQGMSLSAILYDEVQHMYDTDIGNANRTLTASNFGPRGQGLQVYFGTPLQKGSYFWKIWNSSDQRFYNLKCIECGNYFQLYEYESDNWEQIWISGTTISCPHCKKLQNKSDAVGGGKWISTNEKMDDGNEPKYVGYHISQLLIPYLTKEAIIKEKPGIHPTNNDRIWKNEILGEFYSGSDLPMSKDVIYQKCREFDKSISFGILDNDTVDTFMGIDWGGKLDNAESSGGKSFSTVVINSVDKTGTVRIENAFKLKNNEMEHKKNVVDEMFRRFKLKIAVADLGYANDIVPEIQKQYGEKFLGCLNSASLTNPYKYDKDDLRLICNSNIVLEDLFNTMRKGKILFPWAGNSCELLSWLIDHCCSMEKETKVVNGQVTNRFVKGVVPNDGLMSLMYSFLAYKFYLTKGFNLKPHMLNGRSKQSGIILAHLPKI